MGFSHFSAIRHGLGIYDVCTFLMDAMGDPFHMVKILKVDLQLFYIKKVLPLLFVNKKYLKMEYFGIFCKLISFFLIH